MRHSACFGKGKPEIERYARMGCFPALSDAIGGTAPTERAKLMGMIFIGSQLLMCLGFPTQGARAPAGLQPGAEPAPPQSQAAGDALQALTILSIMSSNALPKGLQQDPELGMSL